VAHYGQAGRDIKLGLPVLALAVVALQGNAGGGPTTAALVTWQRSHC
jgi:hypothetical protein